MPLSSAEPVRPRARRSGAARPRCRRSSAARGRRARRGPPRGCRPRRCRPGTRSRRACAAAAAPPPTSTIDSRRCPSQLPLTRIAPRSSGPRCARRSSIRSSCVGVRAAVLRDDAAHGLVAVPGRSVAEAERGSPRRRRRVGLGPAVGEMVDDRARASATAARSTSATASPSRAPVRASTAPLGIDDLGRAEEAQRPPAPGLVRGHDEDLVLDRARLVAEVEVARLAVVADAPRGVHGGRPATPTASTRSRRRRARARAPPPGRACRNRAASRAGRPGCRRRRSRRRRCRRSARRAAGGPCAGGRARRRR